jgi:hypothetical protein
MKRDIRLATIALLWFVMIPVSLSRPRPARCLVPIAPQLQACTATIIPYLWHIKYRCVGEGYGGGGGWGF